MERHGTISGYTSDKCRCDECKKAWAKYSAPVRDENGKTLSLRNHPMPEDAHGTMKGYARFRCRCEECVEVWNNEAAPDWFESRAKEVQHGTPASYTNKGCRCDECKKAWNIYLKPVKNDSGMTLTLRGKGMPDELHGTMLGYSKWSCRCWFCKIAYQDAMGA